MRGKEWLKWLNFNHSTRLYGSSNLQIHLLLCYKGRISFDKTTQTFIDLITPNPIWCKYQAYQIDFSCTDNINHIFQIAILPKIKLLNDIELNHNRILFYFSPCRERGGGGVTILTMKNDCCILQSNARLKWTSLLVLLSPYFQAYIRYILEFIFIVSVDCFAAEKYPMRSSACRITALTPLNVVLYS